MKVKPVIAAVTLICSSLISVVATAEVHKHHTTTTSESGWLPSFGLTYGQISQTGDDGSLSGNSVGAKVVSAMYFRDSYWIADAGIGFQKFYLSQDVRPTIGVVSLTARYAIADRWSVGPSADLYLGNGATFGSSSNQTLRGGLVAFREFPMKDDQLLKIGIKYDTPLFLSGQNGSFIGLTAEWAVGAANSTVRRRYSLN